MDANELARYTMVHEGEAEPMMVMMRRAKLQAGLCRIMRCRLSGFRYRRPRWEGSYIPTSSSSLVPSRQVG